MPNPSVTPAPVHAQVFLDPGHGGVDTGTISVTEDGTIVQEKDITLGVAKQTATILQADGIWVALSRTDDSLPGAVPADYTTDGSELTPDGVLADLQRRVDRANASGARVLLSIHFEAFDDPSVRGAQTFYDSSRSFGATNLQFAILVQTDLIQAFRSQGDDTPDRGVTSDTVLVADLMGTLPDYHHLVVLGPGVPGLLVPSQMPGALSEPLFLSNPNEASAAVDPKVQNLIATAFAQAITQFLAAKP